jgi:hypothetical protein
MTSTQPFAAMFNWNRGVPEDPSASPSIIPANSNPPLVSPSGYAVRGPKLATPDPPLVDHRRVRDPEEIENPEDDCYEEPDDLPPVHIEDVRYARSEQRRQAAHPDYGPEPFAMVEGVDGRIRVKPQLTPSSLNELVLLNKIRRAENEARAARSEPRAGRVHELFTKSRTKTEPMPNDGLSNGSRGETTASARPLAKASGWSWLRARLSTPRKGVWK